MSQLPTKRLLVYVALGVIVMGVGAVAVVSMAKGGGSETKAVTIIDAGSVSSGEGAAGASAALEGIADSATTVGSSTSTTQQILYVQVAGAVRRPGVYQVPRGTRVFQVVEKAGGFTEEAESEAVALAAEVTDGCCVYVPTKAEVASGAAAGPGSAGGFGAAVGSAVGAGASSGTGANTGPVSINSATLEELDTLPGIGPATAQKIIDYREEHGPFTSVEQLSEVPGIGPAKLEQLRPLVGL